MALSLALMLGMAACGGADTPQGTVGFVEGFLGGVVTDEPRAALVGRDALSAGGTAADAAVAAYFTLAVTLPSTASLGGGGICVVHDRESGTVEALDFLPRAPQTNGAAVPRPVAMSGNVRGLFALHARYGRLRWGQLVAPAENLARFGVQVPRALARDMAPLADALAADPETRRVFAASDGPGLVGEGDFLRQLDLAAAISQIRARGPGVMYSGTLARTLAEATRAADGALTIDDLRAYTPTWRPTMEVEFGNLTAHFAPPPAAGGAVAAQMWAMLLDGDDYEDADPEERPRVLAAAAMQAFLDRDRWMAADGSSRVAAESLVEDDWIEELLAGVQARRPAPASATAINAGRPENPSAATLIAVDREGSAVACALTLNAPFGTGRMAPGTGILLAAQPGTGGRGHTALGPMVIVNENVNEVYFAGAASGGVAAPTALVAVAANAYLAEQRLPAAMAVGRVHHGGVPDLVFHEPQVDAAVVAELRRHGFAVAATPRLGVVSALSCSGGLPPKPETCEAVADPRGFGLAASAE